MNLIFLILVFLLCFFAILFLACNNLIIRIFILVFIVITGILFFPFLKAEFLFVVFLTVYLGALVVFFLFVVMISKPNQSKSSLFDNSFSIYAQLSVFFICLFFAVCCIISSSELFNTDLGCISVSMEASLPLTNPELFGFVLFHDYGLYVVIAAALLTVTIIGAFVLLYKIRKK
jgi:NADH-quinone oxidoreductase subunit J